MINMKQTYLITCFPAKLAKEIYVQLQPINDLSGIDIQLMELVGAMIVREITKEQYKTIEAIIVQRQRNGEDVGIYLNEQRVLSGDD